MSDLVLLVNASVTKLASVLARLAVETGHPELADEVTTELQRMVERASLELALIDPIEEKP